LYKKPFGGVSGGHVVEVGPGEVSHKLMIPEGGTYAIWICHRVNPHYFTSFQCVVKQRGSTAGKFEYAAELATEDQSDATYLYGPKANFFVWSVNSVSLKQGEVKIVLKFLDQLLQREHTQPLVDAILVVGDPDFRPDFKSKKDGGFMDYETAK